MKNRKYGFLIINLLLLSFYSNICSQESQVIKKVSSEGNTSVDIRSLVQDYKPSHVLNYDAARSKMYTEIYNIDDTVTCVYTGYKLRLSKKDIKPIAHLLRLNPLKSIITEHSYPKSKGAKEGNAKSDMHHLFPVRLGVNLARYNHPFAAVSDEECLTWFSSDSNYKRKPKQGSQNIAKKGRDTFEPQDSFKGNVARAVFYFYTIYKTQALQADTTFFDLQKEVLLEWHTQDPVDDQELKRTYLIATYQSGKPNPFVIDPTLAYRLYGDPISSD